MRAAGAAILALLVAAGAARAEELVVALSPAEVRISSNFTGAVATVFGAIERDAQTISRSGDYDVVVVLAGPFETTTVRRKERFLGLFINRGAATFTAPGFYALAATRPLTDIAGPALLRRLGLGAERILPTVDPPALIPGETPVEAELPLTEYSAAFLRLRSEAHLYSAKIGGVAFPGSSIFTAEIALPENVPTGSYRASAYLFRAGALLGQKSADMVVVKAGVEQALFDASRRWPLPYALAVLATAGLVGWLAGVIFRRD